MRGNTLTMKKWTDTLDQLIVYKNNQLLACNKPAGVPVQPDRAGSPDLQGVMRHYTKGFLQAIHRLDQPVSGVNLFARTPKALADLSAQFKDRKVEKRYLAVVSQAPPMEKGTLSHHLLKKKGDTKTSVVPPETEGAKTAHLIYSILGESDRYFLLDIHLESGRYHQIRAQLAAIGCPVKGDIKYGFKRANADRSIHLHAWRLHFEHPVSRAREQLVAPLPQDDPLWAFFDQYVP